MPTTTVTSSSHRQLQSIADTIHSSKRILVVTGAGISTNSGIPDFRSTHGLYNQVKARYPSTVTSNLSQGKDLFDSVLFSDPTTTSIFYTFLAELRNKVLDVPDTTPTHKFIRTLAETGRLLRCYTQNIDGLEGREGLATDLKLGKGTSSRKRKRCSLADLGAANSAEATGAAGAGSTSTTTSSTAVITAPPRGCQVVQLHGELDTLRCMHCQGKCEYDEEKVRSLMDGQAPDCPSCLMKDRERREKGKRGTRVGGLRPNIVLYGEEHPQGDLIGAITTADIAAKPDMMIIFGTSLKVHGLKKLVKAFAASIHARYPPTAAVGKKRGGNSAKSSGGEDDDGEDGGGDVTQGGGGGANFAPRVIFVNNQPAANSVWKDVIDAWVDMDCDGFVAEVKKRRPAVWERQERLEAGFRRAAESAGKGGGGILAGDGKGEGGMEMEKAAGFGNSRGSGKGGRVVKNPHGFSTTSTTATNTTSSRVTSKSKSSSNNKGRKAHHPEKDIESDKENGGRRATARSTRGGKSKPAAATKSTKSTKTVFSSITVSPGKAKPSSSSTITLPPHHTHRKSTPILFTSPLRKNLVLATPRHRRTPLPTPPSSISKRDKDKDKGKEREEQMTPSKRRELRIDTGVGGALQLRPSTPSRRAVTRGEKERSPSMSPLSPCPSALELEFENERRAGLGAVERERGRGWGLGFREDSAEVGKRRKVSPTTTTPPPPPLAGRRSMLQAVVIHTPRKIRPEEPDVEEGEWESEKDDDSASASASVSSSEDEGQEEKQLRMEMAQASIATSTSTSTSATAPNPAQVVTKSGRVVRASRRIQEASGGGPVVGTNVSGKKEKEKGEQEGGKDKPAFKPDPTLGFGVAVTVGPGEIERLLRPQGVRGAGGRRSARAAAAVAVRV